MANRYNPLRSVFSGKISLMVGCSIFSIALSLYSSPAEAQTQCTTNDPSAPCFAENDDILGGERSLLRDDDLLVNVWHKGGTENVVEFEIKTSQMTTATQTKSTFASSCEPDGIALTQSVIGRVFALPNDVIASIRPDNACSAGLWLHITDPQNSSNNSTTYLTDLVNQFYPRALAMADFNRDGYQDIFFLDSIGAYVYTAKCTNDPFAACTGTPNSAPSSGLTPGNRFTATKPLTLYTSTPVTGDFNGDGAIDVAWAFLDNGSIAVMFVSVCPSAGVTVLGHTCSQPLHIVSTNTQISTGRRVNWTSHNAPRPYIALTANNFDGKVNTTTGIATAELLVAVANDDQTKVDLTVYRFDANLVPQSAATLTNFPSDHKLMDDGNHNLQLFLASGPLDGTTGLRQAVFGSTIDGSHHHGFLSVIAFDENLKMTTYETVLNSGPNNGKHSRIFGLAVGRFDPPDNPNTGDTDFDQQVAVLLDFNNNTTHAQLFTIPVDADGDGIRDQDGFPLTLAVNHEVSSTRYYDNTFVQLAALAVGDLQGRSLVLGAPSKVTVAQTQPDIILGLPPMHVDFITPPGEVAPRIFNLTVFPNSFNTAYDFDVSSGTQSTRQHNTSYSVSSKETEEGKQVFGNPKESNITIKTSHAETQAHEDTTSQTYDTYTHKSESFSSETEFDDLVAASSVQMNIYAYPVIGQFVCPDDEPDDCDDEEKLPLQVQYSGPDNIVYIQPASAGGFEWYQPVTEPGNIFSYPGSLRLLETGEARQNPQAESGLDLLTPEDIVWESQSDQTVSIEWSAGQGKSQSSGTSHTHSYDTSNTVSGKAKYLAGSTEGSFSYDYNQSTNNSTLTTSTQTLDASTGVTLHRGVGSGGVVEDLDLLYSGQTYIFGLNPPEGLVQSDLDVPTDVKTYGPIEVAHVANMLSTGLVQSGDWWKQAYTVAPDVALNHPQRWLQKRPTAQNPQQVMFNCPIGFTSALGAPSDDPGSCTSTTTQPNPTNVNDAPFYRMKGFFILPGNVTSGPTMTLATLGDVVTLQVRVYNYSLKNMDPDTQVHVRFYAQPWDAVRGQFASGNGKFGFAPAVFIGEDDTLQPIPAFCGGSQGDFDSCSDGNAPLNWTLAQVQWDTSKLNVTTETSWKFWVVVWMTKGGQLVSEIPQHGLTSIPAQNVDSLAEIPVETYSNNLGFYNQVFTLELPTADAVAQAGADKDRRRRSKERSKTPRGAEDKQDLAIEAFEVSPVVLRDRLTTVRIHHRANGRAFDYVRAFLYEGDPLAGGKLLDMDIVPRVPQDKPHVIPFHYLPRACGAQQLFVQAAPVDDGPIVEAALELAVTLNPQVEIGILIERFKGLRLEAGMKRSLLAKLEAAERSFQRRNQNAGLNQLAAFAHELRAQSGKKIPAADAERLIAGVEDIADCVQFKKPKRDKKETKEKKGPERGIREVRAMAR